jgi:signal transduction histidine kinase
LLAGVQLTLEADTENPICWGNEQQLITMITNLVKNGVNYTPQGSVKVRISSDKTHVYIEVSDTGIGIAEEELNLIFDRFYRGKMVGQLTIPGSGIGLALTKEIVLEHQGDIRVESKINEGTTFYISLPRANVIQQESSKPSEYKTFESSEPNGRKPTSQNGAIAHSQNGAD